MASSIFDGPRKLNSKYFEVLAAALAAATTPATAVLVCRFDDQAKLQFFDNSTQGTLRFALLHPEADSAVNANKLFWFELGAERVLDISTRGNLQIPAGTLLYVWSVGSTAPATEKLRIILW